MEPIEKDTSPSDEWIHSLNATCNRLTTQYLNLLKSASSVVALNNVTTTTATTTNSNNVEGSAGTNNPSVNYSISSVAGVASGVTTGSTGSTIVVGSNNPASIVTSTATSTARMQRDPRAGGGYMTLNDMVAPPPLAADVALQTTVQCQLSIENICVATSQILNLIRTLRLSLLLMDDETISAEEYLQIEQTNQLTQDAIKAAIDLENQYLELQRKQLD